MSIQEEYKRSLGYLVDTVDRVRAILRDEPVELPAIAVIGDQSSGKSSVLESLSGIELPRGQGIVTRCALELRLRSLAGADGHERATIRVQRYPHADGTAAPAEAEEHIADMATISDKIQEYTTKLAGDNKGIFFDGCIELTVYKRDTPTLTVIDLPGITRVAIADQSKDIEEQIKRLYNKFITKSGTVILNVLPVNQDFSTSASVVMSQAVDPHGARTLVVVSKIDLAERETT